MNKKIDPGDLASRIKLLRNRERKWSQKCLAKEIGVSFRAIQTYESGERAPSADTLVKMAELFNVSVDYILTGRIPDECTLTERTLLTPEGFIKKMKEARGNIRNNKDVADALNITTPALSNHISRGTIPLNHLLDWCKREHISADWLLLDVGPMSHERMSENLHIAVLGVHIAMENTAEIGVMSPDKIADLIDIIYKLSLTNISLKHAPIEERKRNAIEFATEILKIAKKDNKIIEGGHDKA